MTRSLSGLPKTPGNSGALASEKSKETTPQAVLSYLSLAFEALYTNMFIASEWASYTHERKPLRVTSPSGQQRSTYWLNVPFRYGVPKTAIFGLFHWLMSQSIFTVQVTTTDLDTRVLDTKPAISTCGFSPMAIILTFMLGTIIAIGGIAVGRLRFAPGMPLAGSCSAAISAACHPPREAQHASLLPVQWGAVKHGSEDGKVVGHCSFSSLPVEYPVEGRLYA